MPPDVDPVSAPVTAPVPAPVTAPMREPLRGRAGPSLPPGSTAPAGVARRYSLHANLLGLVLLCVLPAALLSASLAVTNYWLQRERIYRDSVLLADHLGSLLDRELAAVASSLRVLSTSPELQTDDLAGFYRRAQAAVKTQVANNYVLLDDHGAQHVNTIVPWGTPLPRSGPPEQLQQVFTRRDLVVTDLFVGPVTRLKLVAIGVPVLRDGRVAYCLASGVAPARIAALFGQTPLPEGWVAAVLDGSGTIVARTHDPQRFVGEKAVPAVLDLLRHPEIRSIEAVTKEGIPVVSSVARSGLSNWSVAVGAPRATLDAQLAQLVVWGGLSLALALGLGLWLAWRLAGRVTAAVRGLNDAALALGRGEVVVLPPQQLIEADAVGAAIVQAANILEQARHLAHHDALTGLSNRLLFDEMLGHHLADLGRRGGALAVLALDLDGFKAVNDQHGHAAGDRVLRAVGARMLATLRAADVAARLGGDEFAVLIAPTDAHQAQQTALRLLAALSAPFEGPLPRISVSIGVALCDATEAGAPDPATLMARADQALYEAKRSGKARVVMAP